MNLVLAHQVLMIVTFLLKHNSSVYDATCFITWCLFRKQIFDCLIVFRGQNKNNAMVQYLVWRVMTGRNTTIELNFMLAGHTKFSPDRHFGNFKTLFRRTFASSMPDIAEVTKLLLN